MGTLTAWVGPRSCDGDRDFSSAVGAALATLKTDVKPLSSEDYDTIAAWLQLLGPFYQATVELSEEKRVSGSKSIPMTKMLMLYLKNTMEKISHNTAQQLGHSSTDSLNTTGSKIQNNWIHESNPGPDISDWRTMHRNNTTDTSRRTALHLSPTSKCWKSTIYM